MRGLKGKLKKSLAGILAVCLAITSFDFQSWAGEGRSLGGNDVLFIMDGNDLRDSAQAAIEEGIAGGNHFYYEDLELGDHSASKDYERIFSTGDIYEFSPSMDMEGENTNVELRMFVRVRNAKEGYRLSGKEQILFLFINTSEEKVNFKAEIDGSVKAKASVKGNAAEAMEIQESAPATAGSGTGGSETSDDEKGTTDEREAPETGSDDDTKEETDSAIEVPAGKDDIQDTEDRDSSEAADTKDEEITNDSDEVNSGGSENSGDYVALSFGRHFVPKVTTSEGGQVAKEQSQAAREETEAVARETIETIETTEESSQAVEQETTVPVENGTGQVSATAAEDESAAADETTAAAGETTEAAEQEDLTSGNFGMVTVYGGCNAKLFAATLDELGIEVTEVEAGSYELQIVHKLVDQGGFYSREENVVLGADEFGDLGGYDISNLEFRREGMEFVRADGEVKIADAVDGVLPTLVMEYRVADGYRVAAEMSKARTVFKGELDSDKPVIEPVNSVVIEIRYVSQNGVVMDAADKIEVPFENGSYSFAFYSIPQHDGYTAQVDTEASDEEKGGVTLEGNALSGTFEQAGNYTIVIEYTAGNNTYMVRHLFQSPDDPEVYQSNEDLAPDEITDGDVGELTEARAAAIQGFQPQTIEQKLIANGADNNIEIKYDRNEYILNFNTDGGSYVDYLTANYGKTLFLADMITDTRKDGYQFDGWYRDKQFTDRVTDRVVLEGDTTLYAKWIPGDAKYHIVVLIENADDTEYSLLGIDEKTGKMGTMAVVDESTALNSKLFEDKQLEPKAFTYLESTSAEIKPDGSTVITAKYTRNQYTLKFVPYITNENFGVLSCVDEPAATHGYHCIKWEPSIQITEKYQADIREQWLDLMGSHYKQGTLIDLMNTHNQTEDLKSYSLVGEQWIWDKVDDGGELGKSKYTCFQETMPFVEGGTKTIELGNLNGKKDRKILYYVETLGESGDNISHTKGGVTLVFQEYNRQTLKKLPASFVATLNEEFYVIDGYERFDTNLIDSTGKDWVWNKESAPFDELESIFYYRLQKYDLALHNGGNVNTRAYKYTADIKAALAEPTAKPKGALSFDGWFEDEYFKQEYKGTTMPKHNLILYAKWSYPIFDVTFKSSLDKDGGIVYDTDRVEGGKTVKKEIRQPENMGYIFTGWFLDRDCTKKYEPQYQITGHTIIYAGWKPILNTTYTVKYQTDAGVMVAPDDAGTGKVGETVSAKAKVPDERYKDYVVTKLVDSVTLTADPAGNEIIFEYRKVNSFDYRVRYVNGTKPVYTTGTRTTDLSSFRYYPKEFNSSAEDLAGYEPIPEFVQANMVSEGVVMVDYPVRPVAYKITYLNMEGAVWTGDVHPSAYVITDDIALSVPEKDGFTFEGWNYTNHGVGGREKNVRIEPGSRGDLTFTADWKSKAVLKVAKSVESIVKADGERVTEEAEIETCRLEIGDVVHYRVEVFNLGDGTAEDVVLKDSLEGIVHLGGVNFNEAFSLPGQQSEFVTYTYTVKESDIGKGTIYNKATAAFPGGGKEEDDNTLHVADQRRQLSVLKEVVAIDTANGTLRSDLDAAAVTEGDTIHYKVGVVNTGNVRLEKILLTDELADILPAGPIPPFDLAAGAKREFEFTYQVTEQDLLKSRIVNTAVAKIGEQELGRDETETAVEVAPAMEIEKAVSQITNADNHNVAVENAVVGAGYTIHYTVKVKNTGNTSLKNIAVSDNLDGLLPDDGQSQVISELPPGETKEFHYTFKVKERDLGTAITNVASVRSDEIGPVSSNEVAVNTQDRDPKLEVVKSVIGIELADGTKIEGKDSLQACKVNLGDRITYHIVVKNIGNVSLSNVTVTDTLAEVHTLAGLLLGVKKEGAIELAPGGSKTYNYIYTVSEKDLMTEGTPLLNIATATGTDSKTGQPALPGEGSHRQLTKERSGNLDVQKKVVNTGSAADGRFQVGDTVSYEIMVENKGNQTLTNVVITDTFNGSNPDGLRIPPGAEYTVEGNRITIASLAPSGKIIIPAEYKILLSDQNTTLVNTVTVTSDEGAGGNSQTETPVTEKLFAVHVKFEGAAGTEGLMLPADESYQDLPIGFHQTYSAPVLNGYAALVKGEPFTPGRLKNSKDVTIVDQDITVTFVYYRDAVGEKPNQPDGTPNQPDGIPDEFQAIVTYQAVNGKTDMEWAVVNLTDGEGNFSKNGVGRLRENQIAKATANSGYSQSTETWDVKPATSLEIMGDITMTVAFRSGGGSGSGGGGGGPRPGGGSGETAGPGFPGADGTATINPEEVPFAMMPEKPADGSISFIDDGEVPLANLPKTGDRAAAKAQLGMLLTGVMMGLYVALKKRQDGKENNR